MKKIILSLLFCLVSCVSMEKTVSHQGTGNIQTFESSYDKTFETILEVINQNSRLKLVSQDKNRGIILAKTGISLTSYGENVAIFLKSEEYSETRVEVISEKNFVTSIAKNWAPYVLDEMRKRLYN